MRGAADGDDDLSRFHAAAGDAEVDGSGFAVEILGSDIAAVLQAHREIENGSGNQHRDEAAEQSKEKSGDSLAAPDDAAPAEDCQEGKHGTQGEKLEVKIAGVRMIQNGTVRIEVGIVDAAEPE